MSSSLTFSHPTPQDLTDVYTYESIPKSGLIRLLRVKPGQASRIECELYNVSLDDLPRYAALSYCWGNDQTPLHIQVNGRRLNVTVNLHEALQYLQSKEPDVPIWIDAICINQNNDHEKGHQVAQMRLIYASAERVVTWLGASDARTNAAMDWMQNFGRRAFNLQIGSTRDLYILPLLEKVHVEDVNTNDRNDISDFVEDLHNSFAEAAGRRSELSHGLRSILQRQYWKRTWIVQEVYNAGDLNFVCGDRCVDEQSLNAALRLVRGYQSYLESHGHYRDLPDTMLCISLLKLRRARLQGASLPLIYLLRLYRTAAVTEPVDKIYGLLGMTAQSESFRITPDYIQPERSLLINVASALLRQGYFEVLTLCNSSSRPLGLPSWVPEWRSPKQQAPLQQRAIRRPITTAGPSTELQPAFNASAGLPVDLAHDFHGVGNEISLSAVRIGAIEHLGDVYSQQSTRWLQQIIDLLDTASNATPQVLHTACRVAVADQQHRVGPSKDRVSTETIDRVCQSLTPYPDDLISRLRANNLAHYAMEMHKMAEKRRAFRLSSGHVGLAPEHAEVGDEVYVVAGAAVPFIFRAIGKPMVWWLIGEAYVDRAMDGEVVASEENPVQRLRVV